MSLNDELLQAILNGKSVDLAERLAALKLDAKQIEALPTLPLAEAATIVRAVNPDFLFVALILAFQARRALPLEEFDRAFGEFRAELADGACRSYLDFARASLLFDRGETRAAVRELERLAEISAEPSLEERYVELVVQMRLGASYERLGNFGRASTALRRARLCAREIVPSSLRRVDQALASLYWASGQFALALKLHTQPQYRDAAQKAGDQNYLLVSHLSAAKAAIDLGLSDKAGIELAEARTLLDAAEQQFPRFEAYRILFHADRCAREGDGIEARSAYEAAIAEFEALDPVDASGLSQAKTSWIETLVRQGDFGLALIKLGELIDEAERHECLEARTRLLAYQAQLLLDDRQPLEQLTECYEDLVGRVHLMNNPYLTFLAYSDLFFYARRWLAADDQKFWLDRLRGLRGLLERSCYEDLYREYMTERLRQEVEAELDRYGVSWSQLDDM